MAKGQKKDAVLNEKFWFRTDYRNKDKKECSLMTVNEIINGTEVNLQLFTFTIQLSIARS